MATSQGSNSKKRISLDLSQSFFDRLEALEDLTQAESKAGVIRQALQVYEYIARRTLEGYQFQAVSPDGTPEKVLFFSPYATLPEELVLTR